MSTATITQLGDFLASQITLIGGSTLTAASFNNLIDPTQSANNQANTASTLLGVGTMLTAIASPLANISPALCLPVAISGMAVTALSLANNLNQIAASVQEGKQPQLSTVTSAFADVSALTGSTAILYATYASAGTLAVDIAILSAMGPVLAGAAVGLGIATLMMSPEDLASIPDVIYEGFKHFQEITEVLNPFWLNSLGHLIGQNLPLPDDIFDFFTRAQNWRPYVPVDPLALDLDNDGIETTAINGWNGVLFDHNNDGVKTATGWLKGDDGFLVLDRNGNGTIDNGGELFGDNTKLGNGVNATDGFAALADVDTNYDDRIDSNDGIFPLLKVWQDLNQDGISQANELKTLAELGITSLATTGIKAGQTQNGNLISLTGTYNDSTGANIQTANLLLSSSAFHSEFTDVVPMNEMDLARADVHGSGQVRNLRDAAALSPNLATLLTGYSAATTEEQQLALLDELLNQWSQTSSMPGFMANAAEHDTIINFRFGNF